MSREIIAMLDKVASSLESKGAFKEAEALDIIANSIEAAENKFNKPKDPEIEGDSEFIKELEKFSKEIQSRYKNKKPSKFTIENILKYNDDSRLSGLIKTVPEEGITEKDQGYLKGFPNRILYHTKSWQGTSPDYKRLSYAWKYLNYVLQKTYNDDARGNSKSPAVECVYNRGSFSCDIKLTGEPDSSGAGNTLDF